MGRYYYLDPRIIIPSQDFLKDSTVRMIVDAFATGQLSRLPPPPIVRTVTFSHLPVAIDGHNLLAVKLLLGENCLVYFANHADDNLPISIPESGISQRNLELKEKFDLSEIEASKLYNLGITSLRSILNKYPKLTDYVYQTLRPTIFFEDGKYKNYIMAFVHGRFQPFHLQHLEYILSAKRQCDFLYIGITRSDPTQSPECNIAPHRTDPSANLLTYHERTEMISRCLLMEGLNRGEFGFVPIPIDTPDLIPYFIGTEIKCYTTTCDDWNLHKIAVLQKMGYEVESLIDRRYSRPSNFYISGSVIRRMLVEGDATWVTMVSPVVADYLMSIDYRTRLIACCN